MFSRQKDRIKGKCYVFTGYKKTMKVPVGVFRAKTATIWLMHSQLIMLENGRKNMFRKKQTTKKLAQTFLKVKAVTKR